MSAESEAIVSKVEKLIALSSSPVAGEATAAALAACRLIREHDLQVVVPTAAQARAAERARARAGFDGRQPIDVWDVIADIGRITAREVGRRRTRR